MRSCHFIYRSEDVVPWCKTHKKSMILVCPPDKRITFEDYLQNLHASQYNGTDDDMPDDFNNWLDKFDVDEILDLVKIYENPIYK